MESTTNKVPLIQKAAFGAGHLVNNLFPGALGVFSFFLITAFGIEPAIAGLLTAIPRFIDAILDPIIGFLSDNTDSRWGRRRPYIFVGSILCSILFVVQWQMYEANGATYNFWYFLCFSILFIISNAIFATPFIGLGYEMTSDTKERTRLMGFANTIGQIAWMIVPLFWVLIANKDLFDNQADGVRTLSFYVGFACLFFSILPAIFCKEVEGERHEDKVEISFKNIVSNFSTLWKDIKNISKNKPFMKLCGATFMVFNGFQMVASFSYFIIVYYMYKGSYEAAGTVPAFYSIIGAVLTAFAVIPIVTWLANKYGKKNAFIISTVISMIGYVLKWWGFFEVTPDSLILFKDAFAQIGVVKFSLSIPLKMLIPVPFMAFGLGGLFTLMMSMTADVCDLDELNNGLPRREATYGAIYWWMVKVGQSLALALGGLFLTLVGFDANLPQQSAETLTQLRIADIIIPCVTALIAILIMRNYNLDESRVAEVKAELEQKRKERKESN